MEKYEQHNSINEGHFRSSGFWCLIILCDYLSVLKQVLSWKAGVHITN